MYRLLSAIYEAMVNRIVKAGVQSAGVWYPIGWGILLLLLAAKIGLNWLGLWQANLVVSTVLFLIVTYSWYLPVVVASFGGAALVPGLTFVAAQITGKKKEDLSPFELYVKAYYSFLWWFVVVCYLIDSFPLHTRFWGAAAALMAAAVIGLLTGKAGLAKKAIKLWAAANIVVILINMVPGAWYVKYMPFGWDPTQVGTTRTEESVYNLENGQKKMADEDRAAQIERINAEALAQHRPLTGTERQVVAHAKRAASAEASVTVAVSTECPNVSAAETRRCEAAAGKWTNWVQFADGARDNGKRLCHFPGWLQVERKEEAGTTYWRYLSPTSDQPVSLQLFDAAYDCKNYAGI